MKVLVINCGSSSLKFRFIETDKDEVIAKGLCERIGTNGGHFAYQKTGSGRIDLDKYLPDHDEAVRIILTTLTDPKNGVVSSLDEIDAVGHRIVHGGDKFTHAEIITHEVLEEIEKLSELAPIHNPVNVMGIKACMHRMPGKNMVGVFDTAFHHSLPEQAYLYGIPYEYYKKYGIRRYGFHGMSHRYVAIKTANLMGMKYHSSKIVVCHLGNGASITAVENGRSIDTSMGYTPLEGIIMGTRSGSIDPEIVNIIAEKEEKSLMEVMKILNRKSGVFGLSDYLSADIRDLTKAYLEGNKNAVRALSTYTYRIVKYIGAYVTVLNGAHAISFTAGVGENSVLVRKLICDRLGFLGVEIDEEANKNASGETLISTPESKIRVYVVPTDEELSIARQTAELIKERSTDLRMVDEEH
ncbi:MAG: acetate kinase [Lachnospiraceae bacterium]|nr:acetate kinase [Lachnospiraceae bacterium]